MLDMKELSAPIGFTIDCFHLMLIFNVYRIQNSRIQFFHAHEIEGCHQDEKVESGLSLGAGKFEFGSVGG